MTVAVTAGVWAPAAAVLACLVLALLAAVQLGAAAGLPWGRVLWGGRHRVLPTALRVGSLGAVALYCGFAWVLLTRAGLPETPDGAGWRLLVAAAWVLVAFFALGVVANLASRSRAERHVMTPPSVVLTACALVVAVS